MSSSRTSAALLLALLLAGGARAADWPRFGYDAARHNVVPAGIAAAEVGKLRQQRIRLDGTVDSSPIYVRGLFVVTTSYGKTIAIDAKSGKIRWRFTPPGYASWAGSHQITNSSPVADPSRRFVYAAAPNGRIYKLDARTGHVIWSVAITLLPPREKLGTALNYSRGLVVATTGGFVGDTPPYQGHVAAIDASSGRLVHVWNALCSSRAGLIRPSSCPESGAAIWARSGAVVDPATGNLLVATGDGHYDGKTYWGDSVLEFSPDAARLIASYTPPNQAELDSGDVDLGSTAPALIGGFAVQGGKDGALRLLRLPGLKLVQSLQVGGLFSAPAVSGSRLFVSTFEKTICFRLAAGRLQVVWQRDYRGTSPVVAGGLLYVYDPDSGLLRVLRRGTGAPVAQLQAGAGHWNSPIVADGMIGLPEGDANQHRTTGALDIWRLP